MSTPSRPPAAVPAFNRHGVWAIYRFEMARALRTLWQSVATPVITTSLYFVVFGSAIGSRMSEVGGVSYGAFIVPGLIMLTLFTQSLFNASFGEEQSQDYVRTARAKGQRDWVIVVRHMLPNALLPLITVAGLNLGVLLGGTVVTETVFSWPGVGRLIVQAVSQRDYPVVISGVLVISLIFVLVNLLMDLLYVFLDPRVRLR